MATGYRWLRDRGVWLPGLVAELAGLGQDDLCRRHRFGREEQESGFKYIVFKVPMREQSTDKLWVTNKLNM